MSLSVTVNVYIPFANSEWAQAVALAEVVTQRVEAELGLLPTGSGCAVADWGERDLGYEVADELEALRLQGAVERVAQELDRDDIRVEIILATERAF